MKCTFHCGQNDRICLNYCTEILSKSFHFISVFHHFVPHCSLSKRSTTKFSIRHIWGNNSIAGITVLFVYRTLISPLHYLLQQNETIARYLTIGIFLCFLKQIISENFIFETTYKYYLFAFDIDIWPHYSNLYCGGMCGCVINHKKRQISL